MTDTDREQRMKQHIKDHYREETGHELPDHVVDNLKLFHGPSLRAMADVERHNEFFKESYGDESGDDSEIIAKLLFVGDVAASGLVGIYLSRFFSGWLTQIVSGILIALLVFVGVLLATWWVSTKRNIEVLTYDD